MHGFTGLSQPQPKPIVYNHHGHQHLAEQMLQVQQQAQSPTTAMM
jgi:hypothetical protein